MFLWTFAHRTSELAFSLLLESFGVKDFCLLFYVSSFVCRFRFIVLCFVAWVSSRIKSRLLFFVFTG